MPRTTRTQRRSGKSFGEYARSLGIDDMPKGGIGGGASLEPWQLPARRELRTYLVCGQLKPRMCEIIPPSRA